MTSSITENLVKKNEQYVSSFTGGDLALPPAKKYAVVTCMDARIHAAEAYGISLGDAHIIRNAGGVAKDALRSLVISEQLLGTKEILIIKHTDCGMLTFKNEDAYAVVKRNINEDASHIDFLPFRNLEDAVKSDVEFLKSNNLIPDDVKISGWIYDVKTGKVNNVVPV